MTVLVKFQIEIRFLIEFPMVDDVMSIIIWYWPDCDDLPVLSITCQEMLLLQLCKIFLIKNNK